MLLFVLLFDCVREELKYFPRYISGDFWVSVSAFGNPYWMSEEESNITTSKNWGFNCHLHGLLHICVKKLALQVSLVYGLAIVHTS